MTLPHAWHHDQECLPSNWQCLTRNTFSYDQKTISTVNPIPIFKNYSIVPYNLHSQIILVHTEYQSPVVDRLEAQGYLPVHWFSHGIIAQDWYRYAEHDPKIDSSKIVGSKRFLIYNRAWSGSREYRLKFAEMLICQELVPFCHTSISYTDQQTHYKDHRFQNSQWKPNTNLEKYFDNNNFDSTASADYCQQDYQHQVIEVVLETIFDDPRISLTEKSLRPCATGMPFILAASQGSLAYLRRYGFETFHPYIDESYDLEQDPFTRMKMIVNELERISKLGDQDFAQLFKKCHTIAARNQEHFFSQKFTHAVVDEYVQGMTKAAEESMRNISDSEWKLVSHLHTIEQQQQIRKFLRGKHT